jgi:asparagine synthase (glutamine-hydrolysing)
MGAFSLIISDAKSNVHNSDFLDAFMEMQARGPDDTRYVCETMPQLSKGAARYQLTRSEMNEYTPFKFVIGYHRLSINDTSNNGMQPFEDPIMHKMLKYPDLKLRPSRKLVCNGEIYNHLAIKEEEGFTDKDFQSNSDVEVILPLYIKHGLEETLKRLDGDFSFAIVENTNTYITRDVNVFVARDSLGLRPLYMIKDKVHRNYMFSTEMKGIPKSFSNNKKYEICEVPPGTYWSFQKALNGQDEFTRYADWGYYKDINNCTITQTNPDILANVYSEIKTRLTDAIVKRYVNSNRKVGVLFSGGFDSSIILAILIEYLQSVGHNFTEDPICTFTIGDPSSLDVANANTCIKYLETRHKIDIQQHYVAIADPTQMEAAIENIVYILETPDTKTILSGVPFYFLFNYISKYTDVKVLLTGEGLDEICGYKELHLLDDKGFQRASVDLLTSMHKYDILKAEKLSSYYGIEARHPFLDTHFLEYMLSLHPRLKRPIQFTVKEAPIEKYIVRRAFQEYLSDAILWRKMDDVVNNNKIVSNITSNKTYQDMYDSYFLTH